MMILLARSREEKNRISNQVNACGKPSTFLIYLKDGEAC
jgi:hypothetical protein